MGTGDMGKDGSGEAPREGDVGQCGFETQPHISTTQATESEASPEPRLARLISTIEGEIVPRLVLTRRLSKPAETAAAVEPRAPDRTDVSELVRLLLHHDVSVATAFVETVRQRGATLDMVCLELLAPAAREFGVLWDQDECDFMQVTVGLCRLHQLLRFMSPEFTNFDLDDAQRAERRVLLATCPGEQHTFGIALVAQFLRRAGWDVWHEFLSTRAEIIEVCGQHWFSVVGLSVATDMHIDDLADTIRLIRSSSRNRSIGVLVGGPLLVERPDMAGIVGADATAADGPQAVLRAEHIFATLTAAN
jgi:methanogenic corrinoid protein MtbC1